MGLNPFAPLFFWVPKRRDPRPAARRLRRRLEVESLEARVLLTGEPILGDDFADTDGRNPVIISVLANDADTDGTNPVAVNVLSNDRDPDGALDPATVKVVRQPLHGTVSVNPSNGQITYTPRANFSGSDT